MRQLRPLAVGVTLFSLGVVVWLFWLFGPDPSETADSSATQTGVTDIGTPERRGEAPEPPMVGLPLPALESGIGKLSITPMKRGNPSPPAQAEVDDRDDSEFVYEDRYEDELDGAPDPEPDGRDRQVSPLIVSEPGRKHRTDDGPEQALNERVEAEEEFGESVFNSESRTNPLGNRPRAVTTDDDPREPEYEGVEEDDDLGTQVSRSSDPEFATQRAASREAGDDPPYEEVPEEVEGADD